MGVAKAMVGCPVCDGEFEAEPLEGFRLIEELGEDPLSIPFNIL
jgi:hypothetical protein